MPSGFVSSYQVEVTFWSHRNSTPIRFTPSTLDVQMAKSIASPSGSWVLNLGASKLPVNWRDIKDDDWMGIVLRELHTNREHVLSWGPVDSARHRRRTGERGEPVISVTVNGRDFGKAFETDELLFDMYLQNAAPLIPGLINQAKHEALRNAVHVNRQVTPAEAARKTLEIVVPGWRYMPRALGNGKTLGDVLHYQSDVAAGQVLNLAGYVPTGTQKLDSYLRRIFTTPFHEWWYDLRPASSPVVAGAAVPPFLQRFGLAPTVTYRNILTPFHDGAGAHVVEPREELDADLGQSGAERFTLFAASGPAWSAPLTVGTWAQGGGRLPMFEHGVDALSPEPARTFATQIARHGLRSLDVADSTAPTSRYGAEQKVPIEWIADRTKQLFELYSSMPDALSGSISVSRLRPEIRVGDRVVHRGIGYQVAQVQHVGGMQPSGLFAGNTTLLVTKGFDVGMRPPAIPAPWGRA